MVASHAILLELSVIIGIAAILALLGRLIKQPPIIAYLITGILVGPFAFNLLHSTELVQAFARMGVAFLLFIVGLNLDFRILKGTGVVSIVVGFGQIIVTSLVSFFIAIGLGFSWVPALYIAVALAFSSTVVVVKLLADKGELDTLHGRIAIGILIVQDFVAAIVLMVAPVLGGGAYEVIFLQLGKAVLLMVGVFAFGYYVFPALLSFVAKNQEVLFLFSIAWALIVSMLFDYFGFSLEIGALLAGIALASSKYNLEIRGKIKGLRDFFVVLFFVFFGSQLVGPISQGLLVQAFVFSTFILIGNPIIVMTFMKLFGYKKQASFLTGVSLSQVSEFSLILVLLGFTLGHISQELFSLIILITLITIALSSYGIYYSQKLYRVLAPMLHIFDGKKKRIGNVNKIEKKHEIVLFGYNRIGFNLLKAFHKAKKNYVVVDYNPKTIAELSKRGINCIYGDANDIEFLESLDLKKARMVISTIPDLEINMTIMRSIGNKKTMFIPTSHDIKDTWELYAEGASYVIMPHFLGGDFMAHLLVRGNFSKDFLGKAGRKQLNDLRERMSEGHTHPKKDYHGK